MFFGNVDLGFSLDPIVSVCNSVTKNMRTITEHGLMMDNKIPSHVLIILALMIHVWIHIVKDTLSLHPFSPLNHSQFFQ